jgi:hypothetical protein
VAFDRIEKKPFNHRTWRGGPREPPADAGEEQAEGRTQDRKTEHTILSIGCGVHDDLGAASKQEGPDLVENVIGVDAVRLETDAVRVRAGWAETQRGRTG